MPQFQTERHMGDYVLGRLEPYFKIDREVTGQNCGGKRLRIDAVLMPRDPTQWYDGWNVALAVEFKLPSKLNGFKDTAKWFAQCVDYTHTDWTGYGRLPIFACPSLSGQADWVPPGHDDGGFQVTHLLGQFRVGELVNQPWRGWSFIINGHHRQWSQRYGIEEARRTRLRPAVGSR